MDINRLYFKHQISMMRVSHAEDPDDRTYHQTLADGLAKRIARLQQDSGAGAATSWIAGLTTLAPRTAGP